MHVCAWTRVWKTHNSDITPISTTPHLSNTKCYKSSYGPHTGCDLASPMRRELSLFPMTSNDLTAIALIANSGIANRIFWKNFPILSSVLWTLNCIAYNVDWIDHFMVKSFLSFSLSKCSSGVYFHQHISSGGCDVISL